MTSWMTERVETTASGSSRISSSSNTRNNSLLFDVSCEPCRSFRILDELELPQSTAWIRPSAHVPEHVTTPKMGDDQAEHIADQEGVKRVESYPDSYRALRIGVGAEVEYPVENVGNVYLAYDLQLHQDGMIDLETLSYDPDRHWEMEHTVSLGFEFEDRKESPSFSLQLSYHDGRFPLLNYFFQRSRYFSIGLVASL